MSKLTRVQSKTGKTGIIAEGKANDKPKEHGFPDIGRPNIIKEGRKKSKGSYFITKGRKRPNSDSGKRRK